jgi:acyl-CoA synthetase (AMP-forming)/AMP-acid ligase II
MSALCSEARVFSSTRTLVEILRQRSAHQPNQRVYRFLHGDDEQSLTYGELEKVTLATAAALRQRCRPGDRALLIYPPGLEYIAALYACMYAGMIAVPCYAPRPNRPLSRLESIIASAQPSILLTTSELLNSQKSIFRKPDGPLARCPRMATDDISGENGFDLAFPDISPQTPVILQYTSGSTALPKGVILTHGNIVHNTAAIARNFPLDDESSTVFWLPPYHDMGLIGGILQPLCTGFPVTLMSPVAFLQRPARWLQAISQFRATCSGGPNFAYDLCVRRISEEEIDNLDLSNWQVAFNGAEPIRRQTLEDFCNRFARCGFKRTAFHPCYGLAESTLMVTGMDRGQAGLQFQSISRSALEKDHIQPPHTGDDECVLVSCGSAQGNQKVCIVSPTSGEALPEYSVGEIWISGESVAAGYWNQLEETKKTFLAALFTGEAPFLRTGDLGFIREGQLYITGRIKDLIIIRGQNYYPHDIEFTAQSSHPGLQPSSAAAFSIQSDGIEHLILAQEIDASLTSDEMTEVRNRMSAAISETHDLHVDEIVLVRPWSLPRTTSGKMQRYLCRAAYLSGRLHRLGKS